MALYEGFYAWVCDGIAPICQLNSKANRVKDHIAGMVFKTHWPKDSQAGARLALAADPRSVMPTGWIHHCGRRDGDGHPDQSLSLGLAMLSRLLGPGPGCLTRARALDVYSGSQRGRDPAAKELFQLFLAFLQAVLRPFVQD